MYLRLAMIGVLCFWGVVGLLNTARSLPWPPHVPPYSERAHTIGLPTRMSAVVWSIRPLLSKRASASGDDELAARAAEWLVVLAPGTPELVRVYVHQQLANLMYPRYVPVVIADARTSLADYDGVIAAPGVSLSSDWRPTGTNGGFTSYARMEP